jgi:sigma-54 specific flagellar transcriptional regulator A
MPLPEIEGEFLLANASDELSQRVRQIVQFLGVDNPVVELDDPEGVDSAIHTSGLIFLSDLNSDLTESWATSLSGLENSPTILFITANPEKVSEPVHSRVKGILNIEFTMQDLEDALVTDHSSIAQVSAPVREIEKHLVGQTRGIRAIIRLISQVAGTESTVMINGETGSGKEVVAHAIHRVSPRKKGPFVAVNCGAIPGELLESELFGHEKGAFTGAITARQGRFEMAQDGTLFLDEIGDMPLPMQVKLLRVLQERSFEKVGSNKSQTTNARIIVATHRDLDKEIAEGRFREDLFFRLNVFPIEVPSLRERTEDIPLLLDAINSRFKAEGRQVARFNPQSIAVLCHYSWPGNVRELANLIERMGIMFPDERVRPQDLPRKFIEQDGLDLDNIEIPESLAQPAAISNPAELPEEGLDLKEYLNDLEVKLIEQALDEADGVVAQAARRLGMRRTTLVEKIRKYGIQRDEESSDS